MVSGPEVAASLVQWMVNHDGRRRAEVERVAERRKEELLDEGGLGEYRNPMRNGVVRQISTGRGVANQELLREKEQGAVDKPNHDDSTDGKESATCDTTATTNDAPTEDDATATATQPGGAAPESQNDSSDQHHQVSPSRLQTKYNAATLTNVTGDDLAREVRQILIGQRHATAKATTASGTMATIPEPLASKPVSKQSSMGDCREKKENGATNTPASATHVESGGNVEEKTLFCGIDDAARASRQREQRAIRLSQTMGSDDVPKEASMSNIVDNPAAELPQLRKRLRWHALVDSGMGRLGFKTEEILEDQGVGRNNDSKLATGGAHNTSMDDALSDGSISSSDLSSRGMRDTVAIIKELHDAELHDGAPIEFYGMCTHMADANSTSTYTNDQMDRFKSLLYRVRTAGISVPSISTDNSAALLTTSLTHFDPNAILAHDTRGYVRCGGAVYGQRPAFRQLRAVSTLSATVKHIAIIKEGESVGYDRAYVAPHNVRIATLTIGFADGYPRELGNGVGKVSIRGNIFPVAGNVCMDMLMVDLGPAVDVTGVGSTVAVGDTAVLWGPEDINGKECGDGLVPLAGLAATLKTTQSALTCGLDKLRVQRQLVDDL